MVNKKIVLLSTSFSNRDTSDKKDTFGNIYSRKNESCINIDYIEKKIEFTTSADGVAESVHVPK